MQKQARKRVKDDFTKRNDGRPKKERDCASDAYLLKLWDEICRKNAGNKCEFPGCKNTETLVSHHLFSRRNKSVRYCPENAMLLCCGHHTANVVSAHRSPDLFKQLIITNGVRPAEWFDDVFRKKNMIVKDADARQEWGEKLQTELRKVKTDFNDIPF